jgi:CheY-like chemotaxis protein
MEQQELTAEEGIGKRILLVDDDEHVLMSVGDYLAANGYEVIKAAGGREALEQLNRVSPDLILLDVMMPGLDGGEIAQRIRADRRWAGIPIGYLTAAVREKEVEDHGGFIAGEYFISKSSSPGEMLRQIQRLFTAHARKG